MPSISVTRKLAVFVLKHPKSRHVLKPFTPWLMKDLTKDYQRITSGSSAVKKHQQ